MGVNAFQALSMNMYVSCGIPFNIMFMVPSLALKVPLKVAK